MQCMKYLQFVHTYYFMYGLFLIKLILVYRENTLFEMLKTQREKIDYGVFKKIEYQYQCQAIVFVQQKSQNFKK